MQKKWHFSVVRKSIYYTPTINAYTYAFFGLSVFSLAIVEKSFENKQSETGGSK